MACFTYKGVVWKAAIKSICPGSPSSARPQSTLTPLTPVWKEHKTQCPRGKLLRVTALFCHFLAVALGDLSTLPEPQFPLPLKMTDSIFILTMPAQMLSVEHRFWGAVPVLMPLILLGFKGRYWAAKENPQMCLSVMAE